MYTKVEIMKYNLMNSFNCSLLKESKTTTINKSKLCIIKIQKVEQHMSSGLVPGV